MCAKLVVHFSFFLQDANWSRSIHSNYEAPACILVMDVVPFSMLDPYFPSPCFMLSDVSSSLSSFSGEPLIRVSSIYCSRFFFDWVCILRRVERRVMTLRVMTLLGSFCEFLLFASFMIGCSY